MVVRQGLKNIRVFNFWEMTCQRCAACLYLQEREKIKKGSMEESDKIMKMKNSESPCAASIGLNRLNLN